MGNPVFADQLNCCVPAGDGDDSKAQKVDGNFAAMIQREEGTGSLINLEQWSTPSTPDTAYRLSLAVETEADSGYAAAGLGNWGNLNTHEDFGYTQGRTDWKQISGTWSAGPNETSLDVVLFGGPDFSGKAYFTNAVLEEIWAPMELSIAGPGLLKFKQPGCYSVEIAGGSGDCRYRWYGKDEGATAWSRLGQNETETQVMIDRPFTLKPEVHYNVSGLDGSTTRHVSNEGNVSKVRMAPLSATISTFVFGPLFSLGTGRKKPFRVSGPGAEKRELPKRSLEMKTMILWLSICLPFLLGAAAPNSPVSYDPPKVLFNETDLPSILQRIGAGGRFESHFDAFAQDKRYIDTRFGHVLNAGALHAILNKVVKNAFLYQVADEADGGSVANIKTSGYSNKDDFIKNIEADLKWLCDIVNDSSIRAAGRESQGYAVKALAIAYDWADSYFDGHSTPTRAEMENALRNIGDWMLSTQTWYGATFENHGPWDSKMMAYIAAALDDEKYFAPGVFMTPQTNSFNESVDIDKSALGYFFQLTEAVHWASGPRGGWPEGPGYFLIKELPELLEYAEVLGTYKTEYGKQLFINNLFLYAGETLFAMTTPDGMLMKFGDTGQKSALPTEHAHYGRGGKDYGDITNMGAGYLAGYHLYRLHNNLEELGFSEQAQVALAYANEYCFDFSQSPVTPDEIEKQINWLYKFIWHTGEEDDTFGIAEAIKTGVLSSARYYDRTGNFISRQEIHNQSAGTIVRFDGSPYYLNGHQHFAAGHFSIFKNGNLAIDGGRYVSKNKAGAYHEDVYRSSLAHNLVLFGWNCEKGQSNLPSGADANGRTQCPITLSQKDDYADYATGPENVSINYYQKKDGPWDFAYKYRSMKVDLARVYAGNHPAPQTYTRYLVHLTRRDDGHPERPDFVITYDDIQLDSPDYATWQMHFKEDSHSDGKGKSSPGDSTAFQVSRYLVAPEMPGGILKPVYQAPGGDFEYDGRLFVKCLNPRNIELKSEVFLAPPIPPDSWNGRIWEESSKILRFRSEHQESEHEFLAVLYPSLNYDNLPAYSSDIYTISRDEDSHTALIRKGSQPIPDLSRNIAITFARSGLKTNIEYELQGLNEAHHTGYTSHYIFGLIPGKYSIKVNGVHKDYYDARLSYPDKSWGVLVFDTEGPNDRIKVEYFQPRENLKAGGKY